MKSLIVFFLIFLIGCSEDNPVNNLVNNPTPTVDTVTLFTKDSIYVGTGFSNRDSVVYSCSQLVDTLRVKFVLHIVDVSSLHFYTKILETQTMFQFDSTFGGGIVIRPYSVILPVGLSSFSSKTYLQALGNNVYYASLKNIRLWYIKR